MGIAGLELGLRPCREGGGASQVCLAAGAAACLHLGEGRAGRRFRYPFATLYIVVVHFFGLGSCDGVHCWFASHSRYLNTRSPRQCGALSV